MIRFFIGSSRDWCPDHLEPKSGPWLTEVGPYTLCKFDGNYSRPELLRFLEDHAITHRFVVENFEKTKSKRHFGNGNTYTSWRQRWMLIVDNDEEAFQVRLTFGLEVVPDGVVWEWKGIRR